MYLRYVVGSDGEDHRHLTGVITEAALAKKEGLFVGHEIDILEQIFNWFNENVPVPPYSENNWENSSSWMKSESKEAIDKIWEVIALLREIGKNVRVLASYAPGKILYEDEFQIVVMEFAEI